MERDWRMGRRRNSSVDVLLFSPKPRLSGVVLRNIVVGLAKINFLLELKRLEASINLHVLLFSLSSSEHCDAAKGDGGWVGLTASIVS